MNDIPDDLVLVAQRLGRALVSDGDAIERDALARLRDIGPSLVLDIGAEPQPPRRTNRHRFVFAIAAVMVVMAAAIVIAVNHNGGTVVARGDRVRYFLPSALPDGYSLSRAEQEPAEGRTPSPLWRRVYTQRDRGVIVRVLFIDSITPSANFDPLTTGRAITVAGRAAYFAVMDRLMYFAFKDDIGCGFVSVGAVGYEGANEGAPPPDLLDELASISCAPTSAGGRAAAIAVPRGFILEVDHDARIEAGRWTLDYEDPSNNLSPLIFAFGKSEVAPDLLAVATTGSATMVKRNGREYWATTPLTVNSATGAYVAWSAGSHVLTLSSTKLSLDQLLTIVDSVREVDKDAFDYARLRARGTR